MFGTQLKQWAVRVVGAIVIFTAYVEVIDRPLDTTVAYILGIIAFLVAAVTVLVGLNRSSEANIND
jgi:hypothetical protein